MSPNHSNKPRYFPVVVLKLCYFCLALFIFGEGGSLEDEGLWTHNPPRKVIYLWIPMQNLPSWEPGQPARSHWLMFTGLDWLIPMVQCACSSILFIQGLIWENRGVYFGIFPIDGSNFSNWSGFLHTCSASGSARPACGRSLEFKRAAEEIMRQHLESDSWQ